MNFNLVRASQPHVILFLVLIKLLGSDAVDDSKFFIVHLNDSNVVTDNHRVGVLWRLPRDVGRGQTLVIVLAVNFGIGMGLKLAGNVVGFRFDWRFNLIK